MSTNAEITYAVQNDRPSITIRYSAQEEGKSKPDLCDMLSQIQEAITKFQAKPQPKLLANTDVVVQDVPHPTPAMQSPQAKASSINKGNGFSQKFVPQQNETDKDSPGTVTPKQIGKIRVNLKFRNIPEKEFCSSHDVARMEKLSFNDAWAIIKHEDY
jgi:hypothetical protein